MGRDTNEQALTDATPNADTQPLLGSNDESLYAGLIQEIDFLKVASFTLEELQNRLKERFQNNRPVSHIRLIYHHKHNFIEASLRYDKNDYRVRYRNFSPIDISSVNKIRFVLEDSVDDVANKIVSTFTKQFELSANGKRITELDRYCKRDDAPLKFNHKAYWKETIPRYLHGAVTSYFLISLATAYRHAAFHALALNAPVAGAILMGITLLFACLAVLEIANCISHMHGNGIIAATGSQAEMSKPGFFFFRMQPNHSNYTIGNESIKHSITDAADAVKDGFNRAGSAVTRRFSSAKT